jgi:pyruvate dehydrogenase E1 component alpha subunit
MNDLTNLDRDRLGDLLHLMQRIRAFEEAAIAAQKDGLVLGAIHPSIGQEAVAAGICANLNDSDLMLTTHRGHGHTLAKGSDPLAMMRELFGRAGGTCKGKGGSMHIADFGVGMLGANGVVGANIPIAAGAAHGLKLQGKGAIVACIFGDGAVNRGPFLEGLNWARVYDLPILFVCEDNGFSATTRTKDMTGGDGAGARAESIGIPALTVDGNDLLALDGEARDVISDIRAGKGPVLIHAKTYRITGHTAVDPATYRPADEVEAQRANCPIARLEAVLRAAGVADELLARFHADAVAEMNAIAATARETDWPGSDEAFSDVQDVGDPAERAF